MNVTVIYGSQCGATKAVAERIAARLQARLLDIEDATAADFESSDLLVLGSPTYGIGELLPEWEDRLPLLQQAGLAGKKVALFGTGDQSGYADSFVDALGILYDEVVKLGATVVGFTDVHGYRYTASKAERDGRFVGLVLDEDGQASLTERRITSWVGQIT